MSVNISKFQISKFNKKVSKHLKKRQKVSNSKFQVFLYLSLSQIKINCSIKTNLKFKKMEIIKLAGNVANPTEQKFQISKSIGGFLMAFNTSFNNLSNVTIQAEIERANGSNFEITKGAISLQRFILATTYGEDAIVSSPEYDVIANCEISDGGSIHLFEKDVLKLVLKGLDPLVDFRIHGIEEPVSSLQVFSYESKSMGSDDTNKDFNTEGYDVLILDKHQSISEISYSVALSDGSSKIIKHDLFELECIYKSTDPVAHVWKNGNVKTGFDGFLQLPLNAISNVNIRKAQGSVINLLLRTQI